MCVYLRLCFFLCAVVRSQAQSLAQAKKHTKEIQSSDVKVIKKLGNGAFGEVSLGLFRGTEVATFPIAARHERTTAWIRTHRPRTM